MAKKIRGLVPNYKPFIPKESIDNALTTLKTSWIGGDGPKVKEFEKEITKIIKNRNVVAVSSGTAALQIALRLADATGGEVITTPMTCIATNAVITAAGAAPVWADINPETGNIDPYDIAKKITKKTRAIMVVHWGGAPAEVDLINKIASTYNLPVIEDAAQALGSKYNGRPIGSHSDFVAFSMQAIKLVNTIEGGILATKRKSDAKRGKALRWYGIEREKRRWNRFEFWNYPITEIGIKAQMTDVGAAIGLGQIPYLGRLLKHRQKLAEIYTRALLDSKTIKAQKILPKAKPNFWIFTVLCTNSDTKIKLWKAMNKIGVRVEEAHRRNDLYPVFRGFMTGNLPGVDFFDRNHLIIPIGHWVSKKKANEIAEVLATF